MKVLPLTPQWLGAQNQKEYPPDQYKTFKGWSATRRIVLEGQKSCGRNARGEPLFHFDQTDEELSDIVECLSGFPSKFM
jgi:hypothetical protein